MNLFDLAKQVAETSKHPKFRVGAAIHHEGVIYTGVNHWKKTHPLQEEYNKLRGFICHNYLHAEMDAILKWTEGTGEWFGGELWVYRIRKDLSKGMSRPCPACMQAAIDHGIAIVHYTTEIGFATEELD